MIRRSSQVIAVAALAAVTVAACGSSKTSAPSTGPGGSSASTGSSAGAGRALKIGVLTDVTGLAASGEAHIEDGVKAGIAVAAKEGYSFTYVVEDSKTSPTDVLAAAKKLVTQDHVDVVLGSSALLYGAASYLTQQGIPVVGIAEDGPEWQTSKNMFSVTGFNDTTKVTTTFGQFLKSIGATTVGAIGYAISPSSAEAAKAAGVSGEAAGLKTGYINTKVPFGSTDVQPIALAMKNAGVDAFFPEVDPNTSFALIGALKNLKVPVKPVLLIGYGGDLLESGAATLKDADGSYFGLAFQPVEMNTPATQSFLAALKGVNGTQAPGLPTYTGYTSILLLVDGLKNVTGDITDKAAIIAGLAKVTSFDAGGLVEKPFNPTDPANIGGPGNCTYFVQLSGGKFQVVSGADPVCGTVIPGKTITP